MSRLKVTLPKTTSFNEVITLDLKEFGTKHVLWMIDKFSRFMVGKLLNNKKAETIIQALMDHCSATPYKDIFLLYRYYVYS